MRTDRRFPFILALVALLAAGPLHAMGSKEKTPAEKAGDEDGKAIREYEQASAHPEGK
jgi:hypothetical protein